MPIIPADQTGAPVDSSPSVQPSPNSRRVGIRIITFETCSGFTRVTARLFAKPPKAAFVTRLQHSQLPVHAARQLPDLSTTIWVDSSSTGDPRRRGARESQDGLSQAKPRGSARDGFRLAAQPILREKHYSNSSGTALATLDAVRCWQGRPGLRSVREYTPP